MPSNLDDFQRRIHEWTRDQLAAYLEQLDDQLRERAMAVDADRPPQSPSGKEFNDPVWGTIALRPLEVIFLDSPLLQRLREIRQLGVVHLVYPAAGHTRFEHAIGAVEQVQRLITALNRTAAGGEPVVRGSMETVLRLAALVHDVGHGVMSHVSENALASTQTTAELRKDFGAKVQHKEPTSSEIAAYYMVDSPSVRALAMKSHLLTGSLPENAIDVMKKAIIGQRIDSRVPLLHELISGPFDADKLDYMTRDAQMTGVPIVTDIPRLVQKVRAVRLSTSNSGIPDEITRTLPATQAECVITGIDFSGGRTLDELMFGRTLLWDKIYRHQKVRAAEVVVASIFSELDHIEGIDLQLLPYRLSDDELTKLTVGSISALVERELTGSQRLHAHVAEDLARRLRGRRLPVRALAFAVNMAADPYRSDPSHARGTKRLVSLKPFDQRKVAGELASEVGTILTLLDRRDLLKPFQDGDLTPYVWIDPPARRAAGTAAKNAYLIVDGGNQSEAKRFDEEFAETPDWAAAYLRTRDPGYVFAPREVAPYVFIAGEKLVRTQYGMRVAGALLSYSRQDTNLVLRIKRDLQERGYYENVPQDIRPLPEGIDSVYVRQKSRELADRLASYEGPVRAPGDIEARDIRRATIMSPERITTWVVQFGPRFAEAAFGLVERLRVTTRRDTQRAIDGFMRQHGDEYRGASLVPLGDPKDSSAVVVYYAGDSAPPYDLRVRRLGEALAHPEPIVFLDDFIGSGSQSVSILQHLMGAEGKIDLGEARGEPLPLEMQELLKGRRVAFVFTLGASGGGDALAAALPDLGLNGVVHVADTHVPRAFDDGGEFKDRCAEIGRQLLLSPAEGHDAEWVEDRKLGYGNDGFLLAFSYNTPAQTLTCLWQDGVVDGTEWVPLIPRRKKR